MAEITHTTTVTEELRAGRSVTYFTRGVSMRPLLKTADTHVHILPLAGEDARDLTGEIVLYVRANGDVVLHRLICRDGDTCYMRGDNTYGLEPIPRDRVVGVVDLIWRQGAYIDVATDRRYRRYVKRRLRTYPIRWFFNRFVRLPGAISRRIGRKKR